MVGRLFKNFPEHVLTSHRPGPRRFRFVPFLILLALSANPDWPHGCSARSVPPASTADDISPVERILREKTLQKRLIAIEATDGETAIEGILTPDLVHLFYAWRDFRPAWVEEKQISSQVRPLLLSLKNIETEGLEPSDYHLSKIEDQSRSIEKGLKKRRPLPPEMLADFDLLCTDAFLTSAGHLAHGKVDPETYRVAWQGACLDDGLIGLLENALAENRVAEELAGVAPKHPFYQNLKTGLASYRELARRTKWKPLPEGLNLESGATGKEVKEVGKRLLALGDFDRKQGKPGRNFDEILEAAIRRFQGRHGLDASGILNAATLAAFNIPLEERRRQIEANLERWRWLPHDLGDRFIYVNVANFELEALEGSRKDMAMKVVVGSEAWQTPDFSSQMTHLIVNPDWTIPIPVILKETYSYVLQDPCYFRDNRMVILRKEGEELVEVDPGSINWAKLNEKNMDFLIRQKPGPDNILGRLKFVFPNKYEIFLHDTPYQEDFAKAARAYSHGCIRAEKPVELAVWVLRGKPGWDLKQIYAAIDAGEERTVKLVEPINVYFLYSTAWAGDDGAVQFRPDIYERDKKLIEALGADRSRSILVRGR
jgi:murein L,D-transpeptidase YcbB/YkuD